MDQLTALERALLEQFRLLANEFDQSESASEEYSKKVGAWQAPQAGVRAPQRL